MLPALARFFSLRPSRSGEPELMDLPGQDPATLAEMLEDLTRLNRLFGGIRITLEGLEDLAGELPRGSRLEVLDVATGAADFPRAMAAWARRRGLRPRVLATDLNPEILDLAAHGGAGEGGAVEFALADARRLPFDDGSFDVATCSLFLHHLEPDAAVEMLKEMRRVARRGAIVNDLVRSWYAYWATRFATRVFARSPLTRHDGPLSIRRSYTRDEMATLADRAGLGPVRFRGALGYRVAMIAGRPA